ncbi:MAG: hypothetical protein AAB069_00220, partial [Planctomycetota bacterium]
QKTPKASFKHDSPLNYMNTERTGFKVKPSWKIGFMGNKENPWRCKAVTKTPLENWNKRGL